MKWIKKIFGFLKNDNCNGTAVYLNNPDKNKNSAQQQPQPQPQPQPQIYKNEDKNKTNQYKELEIKFLNPPTEAGIWYYLSESSKKIYIVDLNNVTCNCPNFLTGRVEFQANDPRRYCKHLFSLAIQNGFCNQINNENELVLSYLQASANMKFSLGKSFYLKKIDNNDIFVIKNWKSEWIDIYTRKKRTIDKEKCTGEIERYGYNPEINRWSYGYAPYQPLKIKSYLSLLPQDKKTQIELSQNGVDFSINSFLKLNEEYFLTKSLTDYIYIELYSFTDIDLIKKTLHKINNSKNIDKKLLASNWIKHGKNLSENAPLEAICFFENAMALNSKCGAENLISKINTKELKIHSSPEGKSINQSEQEKRKKLSIHDRKIIILEKEKEKFDHLEPTKEKNNAIGVINMYVPEWYDRSKNHTYIGYKYVEFVRNLIDKKAIENRKEYSLNIINYISSLAILDGTISENTLSEMFIVKGQIALKYNNDDLALTYFNQALLHNEKASVKRIIKKLSSKKQI